VLVPTLGAVHVFVSTGIGFHPSPIMRPLAITVALHETTPLPL